MLSKALVIIPLAVITLKLGENTSIEDGNNIV